MDSRPLQSPKAYSEEVVYTQDLHQQVLKTISPSSRKRLFLLVYLKTLDLLETVLFEPGLDKSCWITLFKITSTWRCITR